MSIDTSHNTLHYHVVQGVPESIPPLRYIEALFAKAVLKPVTFRFSTRLGNSSSVHTDTNKPRPVLIQYKTHQDKLLVVKAKFYLNILSPDTKFFDYLSPTQMAHRMKLISTISLLNSSPPIPNVNYQLRGSPNFHIHMKVLPPPIEPLLTQKSPSPPPTTSPNVPPNILPLP